MNEMIWEDVHNDLFFEYPFYCFAQLPTLQEMASYRVCQATWHSYRSSQNIDLWTTAHYWIDIDDETGQSPINDLLKSIKIPNSIKEILFQAEHTMSYELYNYLKCLGKYFSNTTNEHLTLRMDTSWCVWLPNGKIDYRRSATEMLKSDRLNEMQKFTVMSKMCLEDEIKNTSLNSLPQRMKNTNLLDFDFHKNPLRFYWVCYLKNKLRRVPLNRNRTLERTMAFSCYKRDEMIGFEYFWLRMTNDDRISTAEEIISLKEKLYIEWPFLERLFSSISSFSTKSLAYLSARYLGRSVHQSLTTQHQLRIWHRFKDEIAARDFASIIKNAFDCLITSQDSMRILVDMWDTAYEHHKEYLDNHGAKSIIESFTSFHSRVESPCPAAIEMVYRILSRKPEHKRSKVLKQHGERFASQFESVALLQKMLDLCLPNAIDQSEFKNMFSRSQILQKKCVSLLQQGRHVDLNAKLEWLFSDRGPNAVNEYKKQILQLMTYKYASKVPYFFISIDMWNELREFIDQVFGQDAPSAFNTKRLFIEQAIAFRHYTYKTDFHQYFDITKEIIENTLPIEDLKRFKRKHLDYIVERFHNCTYWNEDRDGDEIFLSYFVEWCCDYDEQSISEFKQSVPPGAILTNAFAENDTAESFLYGGRMSTSDLEKLLCRLDRYLKWFVGSDERVRECKLQAIESCTIDVSIFKRACHGEQKQLRNIVLRWFCSGDEQAAKRFKKERL